LTVITASAALCWQFGGLVLSALLTVVTLLTFAIALGKARSPGVSESHREATDWLGTEDVYGRELDSWGNVKDGEFFNEQN
jgi:hypothetical protein